MSADRRAGRAHRDHRAGAASAAARSFLRAELDGVRYLAPDDTFADADMLVFVAEPAKRRTREPWTSRKRHASADFSSPRSSWRAIARSAVRNCWLLCATPPTW